MNPDALRSLTSINLDDLVNAFGFGRQPLAARFVRSLFFRPAQEFAWQMLRFDELIGARGLAEAACETERLYVRDVRIYGGDCIPAEPAIFLANHPGLTDTLALFTALAQPDLRVIALDRPFLLSLPNLTRQLFFVTDQPHERVALVRRVHRHLQAGGSLLTFPAGHNEPDPDVHPGAVASLDDWTDSVGVFVRLRPETPIVPVVVRGVTWTPTTDNLLVRSHRTADDRQLLASALQLLANVALRVRPVTVRVQVGEPIRASELGTTDPTVIHQAVLRGMRSLLQAPPVGQGLSLL